jgi:tetratricopeptide (TPR) repeat protein
VVSPQRIGLLEWAEHGILTTLMRAVVLLFAAAVLPSYAASEWLKITSSNFEMYTTAGATDGRRTLEYFEQVRDFFMRVRSQQVTTQLPVTIVAFKNAKEYKPYTMRETAVAYFTGDEQRDYIVMSGVGSDHFPTAVHEYMHLLVRHSGLKLPVWMNEGIAEVYSTLRPLGEHILIGTPPQGRGYALAQHKWIPLDRLLTVTHASPEFDEKNRTGLLYSQSWLLTHMLMLGEAYAKQFGQFTVEVSNSGSSEAAFRKIYGKDLAQVDRDLQAYYRSNALKGVSYETKLQRIEVAEPREATEFETELTLTKLVALLRRRDEAGKRYEELARKNPGRWEIYEAIGHLYWYAGDRSKAKQNLRRAVDLKSPSWKTYWDYARLGHGEESVIDALKRALELNPGLAEARMLLGLEYNNAQKYQEAFDALSTIKHVAPDRASSFYLAKAYSAMQLGKNDEARASAESAKKYSQDPSETLRAQQLIDHLDRTNRTEGPQSTVIDAAINPSNEPEVQTMRGALQEVECLGKEARLMVTSGASKYSLLIRDPGSIRIKNSSGDVNLTCGLQTGARVAVGVIVKDDAKFKTMGDVVTLEFQ